MKVEADQQVWDHNGLYKWVAHTQPEHIVCERFEYRMHLEKADLFSRELIGVVSLYVQERDDVQLYMQMPREVLGKTNYFSNEKLKETRVFRPGKPHANDAMRHLLYWYTFKQGYQFNKEGYH